ncbi:MAG: HU family DNA-binding protein [Chloroflexota bacterium]|nr:HU family DNA-binding protein [Chloroflexota bacterium]
MTAISTSQIIDDVAQRIGLPRTQAKQVVVAVFVTMTEQLDKGERIRVAGFGSFDIRVRAERQGTNPKNKERITIPASKTVGFRPASTLRQRIAPPGQMAFGA